MFQAIVMRLYSSWISRSCTWKIFYGKKGKKHSRKPRPRYEDEYSEK